MVLADGTKLPWTRRLKSIRELPQRRTAAARLLRRAEPARVALELAELCALAGRGVPGVIETLDALIAALGDDELVDYDLRRSLYHACRKRGDDDVARLFLDALPGLDDPDLADAKAPARAVVPRGRVLTLGERKALARGHRRDLLLHLLRDPHPDVTGVLLDNPHLTERDALVLAARRPSLPACISAVSAHHRWGCRYRIKRAVVSNPYAPPPIALRVATTLRDRDLDEVSRDPSLRELLRTHARELLARRRARAQRDRG